MVQLYETKRFRLHWCDDFEIGTKTYQAMRGLNNHKLDVTILSGSGTYNQSKYTCKGGVQVTSPSPCWMTLTMDFACLQCETNMAKISLSFESHRIWLHITYKYVPYSKVKTHY